MSVMDTLLGGLKKIKIECFSDPSCSITKKKGEIEAFINPKSYTRKKTVEYTTPEVISDSGQTYFFSKMGEETLVFDEIIVDGTGLTENSVASVLFHQDVETYVQDFQEVVCQYDGDSHSTNYLKISWGKLSFKCVCKSVTVKYTLFKPDGTPLRASINMELQKNVDWQQKAMEAGNNSPDLTHLRTVKAGDTLPLMSYQIYGDSSYYMEIARVNKLSNINAIKPGDQLYFPPLKK